MSGDSGKDAGTGAVAGAGAGASFGPWGAVIGGVIGAVGGLLAASSQSDIDNQKADAEKAQAAEVANREAANDAIRKVAVNEAQVDMGSSFAGTGRAGTGIGSQLEMKRQGDLQTLLADQDAKFQENMILRGAAMQNQLADTTKTAGYFNAGSTVLGAAGKAYTPGNQNPGTAIALPANGENYTGYSSASVSEM